MRFPAPSFALCLCPSHGPSLCCCALLLYELPLTFLQPSLSLPALSPHQSLSRQRSAVNRKPESYSDWPPSIRNLLSRREREGSSIFPVCFVFRDVLFVNYCPKCIITSMSQISNINGYPAQLNLFSRIIFFEKLSVHLCRIHEVKYFKIKSRYIYKYPINAAKPDAALAVLQL